MSFIPNILIVDNEPRICHSLKYLLAEQGYETDAASTGSEGMKQLTKKTYAVAVIDMVMPDISGQALIEYIKSYHPDTLVIVMTGYASAESAVKAFRMGAYDYLIKPFEFELLKEVIQKALRAIHLKISSESSGKIYQALIENSPDIIYTLDPKGKFSFVNTMFETLLGFAADKCIGEHYTNFVHPEDINRAQWHLNERRKADRSTKGYKLRLRTQNKQRNTHDYIIVELNAFGMYQENYISGRGEKFIGTYGIARDITGTRKNQDRTRQLEKMESIRTLAGGIAHDFNNALSVISGYASLLETIVPYEQQVHKGLQSIKNAADKMADLSRKLLAYSEQAPYQTQPINLNDTVKQVVKKASALIKPSVALETDLSPHLALVEGDLLQLEQVLMSLLMNSCEAIEAHGIVSISTKNIFVSPEFRVQHPELYKDRYVLLQVKDTGIGMDEATLKRAFDPFFTTKFVGRGLGLSAVLGIINGHGGYIYIQSRKGHGTKASVCLPRATSTTKRLKKIETKNIQGNAETILIIEDNEISLDVTEKFFSKLGYGILKATTAQEALNELKMNPEISLVLLNIDLPDMNGAVLYPYIKKTRPDLKVIACTGYPLSNVREKMIRTGLKDFIQKPFRYNDLAQKVRQVLDR